MRISVAALVVVALLTGCSVTQLVHHRPVVAVSREAIDPHGIDAKAEKAVTDYFDVSAQVAADGGANPNRMATVVTQHWLTQENAGFAVLRKLGTAQTGTPTVTKLKVTATRGIAAVTEVVVHACTSLDGIEVVSEDASATPAATPMALLTIYLVPVHGVLKVDGVEPRRNSDWCAQS